MELPLGPYTMGPITDDDQVIELKMSPNKTMKHLLVGDAVQMISPEGPSVIPDLREALPKIKEMSVYDDDVFVIAYAKSGSHWTWEIVNMLAKGTTEYEKMSKERRQLEFHLPETFDDMPRPRVFNTHFLLNHIPQQAIEKKCKIITVQRNPKDVVVSMFHHLKGILGEETIWEDFVTSWMHLDCKGTINWFYYTKKLEEMLFQQKDVSICNVFYEDLKINPAKEVKRIVEYLGKQRSDDFINEVIDKCGFQNMKEADEAKVSAFEGMPKELFSFVYRKGDVGDWKNHFTVAQNEQFDQIYNERMKDLKFTYKYTI